MSDIDNTSADASVTTTRAYAREEVIADIFARIASGESMNKICQEDGMPARKTLFSWIAEDAEIQRRYELALVMRTEVHAEQILDIADDGTNDSYTDDEGNVRVDHDVIARSKLRVDARKWHMSKMNPKRYGDKITQEHTGANGGAIEMKADVTLTPDEAYMKLIGKK